MICNLLSYKFSSYFRISSKADAHKVAIVGVGDFLI